MTIETLIAEMQAVKQTYPTLEISDVLRIFTIQATRDLANEIQKMRISNG
jgi:hypothetical protein